MKETIVADGKRRRYKGAYQAALAKLTEARLAELRDAGWFKRLLIRQRIRREARSIAQRAVRDGSLYFC